MTILREYLTYFAITGLVATCALLLIVSCGRGLALAFDTFRSKVGKIGLMVFTTLAVSCTILAQKSTTNAPSDGALAPLGAICASRLGGSISTNTTTETVCGLRITAFELTANSFLFRVEWPQNVRLAEDRVGILATTNLVSSNGARWHAFSPVDIDGGVTSLDVELFVDQVPEGWSLHQMFFKLYSLLDSDGDGLADALELNFGTDPQISDSDGDGLLDGEEIGCSTNPNNPDSDGDGLTDREELLFGSNPNSGNTRGDGIGDAQAYNLGLSPVERDSDGDGLDDEYELSRIPQATNPRLVDTDDDGISDGDETNGYGSDPCTPDTDGDSLTDFEEICLGTDPLLPDSDGDGLNDYAEMIFGTNPRDTNSDGDALDDWAEIQAGSDPTIYNILTWVEDKDSEAGDDYEISSPFSVDIHYSGAYDSGYSVLGISPMGGTTTTYNLEFEEVGTNGKNGFTMNASGAVFRSLKTGIYRFQIESDDNVDFTIGPTNVTDRFDFGHSPSEVVSIPLRAGAQVPMSCTFSNAGGRSRLHFEKFGEYTATEKVQLTMSFNKEFVQCPYDNNTPLKKEEHVFLNVLAWGGRFGGRVTVLLPYNLRSCQGEHLPSWPQPLDVDLPPHTATNILYSLRGSLLSVELDDVVAEASIIENETSYIVSETAKLTVVQARICADFDRNLKIDSIDYSSLASGTPFRHWINSDNDTGDCASLNSCDIPECSSSSPTHIFHSSDANNMAVDGRSDLLDFAPICLDIGGLLDLIWNNRNDYSFYLKHEDSSVNFLWTPLTSNRAGSFLTNDVYNCGAEMDEMSYESDVSRGTMRISEDMLSYMKSHSGRGIFLVEGASATRKPIVFECKKVKHINYGVLRTPAARCELQTRISSVEDMYERKNFRAVCGDEDRYMHESALPGNVDPSMNNCKHLFFIHGANVSIHDSRAWSSEVFRRLWQSGARFRFHGVTWRSDEGASWNYQPNVVHAFETAKPFADYVNSFAGIKVVMAHSLGNMVVSSAIQDHDMDVNRFLMCNSAVPSEAYYGVDDTSIRAPQMVHPNWESYPQRSWASNYHKLFQNSHTDGRRMLGWPGRFSRVLSRAVNFFSSGDEVLELNSDNDVGTFSGVMDGFGHLAWHKQEMFKGCGGIGGTDWSGWSIRRNPPEFNQSDIGFPTIMPDVAANMSTEEFKTSTVFHARPDSFKSPLLTRLTADAHLAMGVPALAPAMGIMNTNIIGLQSDATYDLNNNSTGWIPHGWPRDDMSWLHSDIKDVGYFFNYMFYKAIIQQGGLR